MANTPSKYDIENALAILTDAGKSDLRRWLKDHPKATFDQMTDQVGRLPQVPDTAKRSPLEGLSTPGNMLNPMGNTPFRASSAGGSSGSGGAAPAAVPNTPNPDAASALKSTGNPAIDAAITKALSQGAAGGTINYWSSSGVDPTAPVLGTQRAKPFQGLHPSATHQEAVSKTADAWLKGLYAMSPVDLADLQHRLWSQGWYSGTKATDPSMIQYGHPDAATLNAYISVLGETARYNYAGKHIGIDGVIDLGSPDAKTAKAAQGQPYVTTNPADLQSALKSQAQQMLGRDPTAADLAAFQSSYLGQEDAARRQLIAAGIANRTEGVTGPPSPTAGAEQYIDTHDLTDRIAYGAAARQQAFYSMLKSPA